MSSDKSVTLGAPSIGETFSVGGYQTITCQEPNIELATGGTGHEANVYAKPVGDREGETFKFEVQKGPCKDKNGREECDITFASGSNLK